MKDVIVNEACQISLERTVAEWQGPIYNLAYRMLGNEADAADATQDVFLAIVKNWKQYDPSRALKPWLLELALNRIRNFHRGAAARLRRERAASINGSMTREEGDAMEDRDLKRRVHDALARLPAQERALIALHYYNGLSHGEMGAVLSLPRTTVQSRLSRALERLRRAMLGLGCVVSASTLEAAMRATPPIDVPAGLALSLSSLPATAGITATAAAALPATLGGLIMAKKMTVAMALLGCLALAGGAYSTGRQQARAEMERVLAAEAASAMASRQEQERLRAAEQQLSREVQALRARLERQKSPGEAGGAPSEPGEVGEKPGDRDDRELPIDWSKLSSLVAEHLDLIYELHETRGERQPTKEERRIMAELESTLQSVLSRARQLSDNPFYDARVLLGMCEALFTPALGLGAEQEKDVRTALARLFAERVEGFDPDAALPAETYAVRQSFLSGLDEAVGRSLDGAQADRWQKISALARRFFEGDRDNVSMPWAPDGGMEAREAEVVKQWQKAFALGEGQGSLVQPLASNFLTRADSILASYGQLDAAPRQLTPAEKAQLNAEILGLQIEVEKQLLGNLTPEQREALRGVAPIILNFAPGDEHWSDSRRGSPL